MRPQDNRFSAERRMLHDNLLNEFAQLVEQSRRRGELTELARERERRGFPRLRVGSPDLWIDTVVRFSVIDMSPSGAAMRTSHPVQPGEALKFALGPIRGADAQVVSCELERESTEVMDARYCVRCKFNDLREGMALIVKIGQLDALTPRQ